MRWWRSRFGADLLIEVAQLAALLLLYKLVRYWSRDQFSAAVQNAQHVIKFQRSLPVPNEVDLTQISMRWPGFVRFLNQYYVIAHFTGIALFLVWMYVRRPDAYRVCRRTLIWMTAIGMVLHVIYPLAPPRMFPEFGFIDTGRLFGPRAYGNQGAFDGVSNQIAAMPSLHFGWAVLVGWGTVKFARSKWRWIVVAHPILTLLAIIITANHYWLDAFVALVIFAVCMAVILWRDGATAPRSSQTLDLTKLERRSGLIAEPVGNARPIDAERPVGRTPR
ncbi:MAG TPA: phosphatase PAP2 family protein [Acidimicrobiales bacterium]|nr:phosphatase PAP2 family protein [Acidimicrobiales bacterium]